MKETEICGQENPVPRPAGFKELQVGFQILTPCTTRADVMAHRCSLRQRVSQRVQIHNM